MPHSAALLGPGSEVLGYDTDRSRDHAWPAPIRVFTTEAEASAWLTGHLGFDPTVAVTTRDWLLTPQQRLLEVTAGPVFADDLGLLGPVRARLAWYPDDVWRWLLACQWRRVAQEEPFVGRALEVHDALGARLLAARLARDLMRLVLLQERRYAPYGKWLGSAFAGVGGGLERLLDFGLDDPQSMVEATVAVAERHDRLGLTDPVDASPQLFHDRPYVVLGADRFADACRRAITDPWLASLPLVGSVDQWVDSTDVLTSPGRYRRLGELYGR